MARKKPLDRTAYVDAALEVIADVGVAKMSMRKVALHLDVSPMAIYKHFEAKEDLLAAALDEFISRANVIPEESLPWAKWVEQVGRGMYQALTSEMTWVPHLGSLQLGTQAGAVTDAFSKKLCAEGFKMEDAIAAYFAVIQIAIGAVCLQSSLGEKRSTISGVGEPLSLVTQAYLNKADIHRLNVAPALEASLKRDQIDIGLPLIVTALGVQLEKSLVAK